MKKLICVGFSFVMCNYLLGVVSAEQALPDDMTVAISASEYGKMPLMISVLGQQAADVQMFAELVCNYLGWSRQFDVCLKNFDIIPSKQELLSLADKGFPLIIFVQRDDNGKGFSWRLYDTTQPAMLKGKHMIKRGPDARIWAQDLSDLLWPVLTGQDGFFSTKLAYCKAVKRGKKRPYKYLCVADFDGNNEEIKVPTVVVAPRWGKNGLLFYSECTNSNVRLMYVDAQDNKHVASNFDGLNMLPSFSQDGKISVFCASRGQGSCQLYYCAPGVFKQLTHNDGNNVSPALSPDGSTVYFCSDYKTGKPGIYSLDIQSGQVKELISSGLCPSYSAKNNKLAYLKQVKGRVQIFIYDIDSGKSEQLTVGAGDKDECSWSSCGNYIYYSICFGMNSRIAAINVLSREVHWITKETDICTYPAISPFYGVTMSDMMAATL